MKKILKNTGKFLSFIFPISINERLAGINRMIYTGYKSRKMKSFGENSVIHFPVEIKGEQYIFVGKNTTISKRNVITAWNKNEKMPEITIGNNVAIGEDCHITASNRIVIGNDVLFGKKITVTDNSHGNTDFESLQIPPLQREVISKGAVIIKDKVWIGDKATILPNVIIGEGAIIGANSVVTKDVPDYCIAAGNPAKVLKNVKGGGGLICVIILYFPDIKLVKINIEAFINEIDKLIIFDNTPIDKRRGYETSISEYKDKIVYLSTDKNEGTAFAYNRAAEWGIENGYDYLLLMDQDSTWKNFGKYKQMALDYLSEYKNAIISPSINMPILIKRNLDTCISSGMLLSLALYQKIGQFEEKLFVDAVDVDYCLRAREMNVNIIKMSDGMLLQRFGNTEYSKVLNCYTRNDSPERTYNIIVNHLLIIRKYHKILYFSKIYSYIRNYIIVRLVKVIFLEKNKYKKIKSILTACWQGLVSDIY